KPGNARVAIQGLLFLIARDGKNRNAIGAEASLAGGSPRPAVTHHGSSCAEVGILARVRANFQKLAQAPADQNAQFPACFLEASWRPRKIRAVFWNSLDTPSRA